MDNILEYKGLIVIVVFLLLFIWEHIKPATPQPKHPIRRIIKNLSFWPINIGLSLAIILPISHLATQHTFWVRPEWFSSIVAFVIDILILDLFIYVWHRAVHEIQFFWRFHEVHHLDETLDTSSAIRFHFGEIFFATFIRAIVIIIFSIPFMSIIIFEIMVLSFTLFHHSNIKLPRLIENIISKIIITPSIHWVHHHTARKDTDSNYGTIFSFWDHLFKTKSNTARFQNMNIGVERKKDTSFLKLLYAPFLKRNK
jgi:sterol desaturase/sphingolipid hydroxylase (fatty acid hydroxylase superfamily)